MSSDPPTKASNEQNPLQKLLRKIKEKWQRLNERRHKTKQADPEADPPSSDPPTSSDPSSANESDSMVVDMRSDERPISVFIQHGISKIDDLADSDDQVVDASVLDASQAEKVGS